MAWFRLSFLLVGGLLVVGLTSPAAPPEQARVETLLAVQTALQHGREHLQRGHYLAAVQALEAKIEIIDGHKEFLRALRDAYMGLIRELRDAGKPDEAETYVRRLRQVDPGATLELQGKAAPLAAAPAAPPAPPGPPLVPNPFTEKKAPAGPTTAGLTAATTPPGGTNAVRGVPAADPFAPENDTQLQEARGFLVRAEREFVDEKYAQALKYYDLTHSVAPKLLDPVRERWAYCKLHAVVAALNQPGNHATPQELEQAARQAMSMAPEKLDKFGQEILRKIADRQAGGGGAPAAAPAPEATAEVRHLGRQGNWNVAETTNFRLYHQLSQDTAEKAARTCEATRAAMSRKWFNDAPPPWQPKCDVYLHPTGRDYAQATQQSPSIPGHSTIQNEGERILSRRIDLHVDDPNALVGVLPHETTHIVLAGRFGPKPLPRWADEGIAVLSEPPDRIQKHLDNLPKHYRDGLLFRLSHLLSMDNYPDARSVGAFYAQGVSLCDYLTKLKGPQVLTQFLRDGVRGGWEPAIQKHYGAQGYADLERQWLAATVQNGGGAVARNGGPGE